MILYQNPKREKREIVRERERERERSENELKRTRWCLKMQQIQTRKWLVRTRVSEIADMSSLGSLSGHGNGLSGHV